MDFNEYSRLNGIHDPVTLAGDTLAFIAQQTERKPALVTALANITPAGAKLILEVNRPEQRLMKPRGIARIRRDIERGRWKWNGEFIKFDWDGKLIDGQNRMTAVGLANREIFTGLLFNLAPVALERQDYNMTPRSVSDILRAKGIHIPDQNVAAGVARRVATWEAFDSLDYWSAGRQTQVLSNMEIVDWLLAHKKSVNDTVLYLGKLKGQLGPSSNIGGPHYVITHHAEDQELAQWFWDKLREPTGLGATAPVYQLRKRLRAFEQMHSRGRRLIRPRVYQGCLVKAWNYSVLGRDTRRLNWNPNLEEFPYPLGLLPETGGAKETS